ncbi:HEAT repeat-containing protein [Hathewaya proteolytica DSM 3090]|uniref:HEAT repeat-containing protein n=1 Tax=Hathewaya proteolytica DSM 3090 TaxID=1121331 RepID=A0A1M6P9A0_9CLOT|nr:HEAT repeat domain-containing protein [Hathewaya proteolytica]SHK04531.1 HEAT repeat-containing protein [Hathewaya proteolytica DSM 3090]
MENKNYNIQSNKNWNNIDDVSEEDITYFLFLEDKPIDSIAKIRHLTREQVQQHIIKGKLKYGVISKCKNSEELFQYLCKVSKESRLKSFETLNEALKSQLCAYIVDSFGDMNWFEKEKAIWIIGELNYKDGTGILIKCTVHDNVTLRRLSVSALGKLKSEQGEMALIRALEDQNNQVVSYAISSLMKINSVKCKEKIEFIMNNTDKDYIREKCKAYLHSVK